MECKTSGLKVFLFSHELVSQKKNCDPRGGRRTTDSTVRKAAPTTSVSLRKKKSNIEEKGRDGERITIIIMDPVADTVPILNQEEFLLRLEIIAEEKQARRRAEFLVFADSDVKACKLFANMPAIEIAHCVKGMLIFLADDYDRIREIIAKMIHNAVSYIKDTPENRPSLHGVIRELQPILVCSLGSADFSEGNEEARLAMFELFLMVLKSKSYFMEHPEQMGDVALIIEKGLLDTYARINQLAATALVSWASDYASQVSDNVAYVMPAVRQCLKAKQTSVRVSVLKALSVLAGVSTEIPNEICDDLWKLIIVENFTFKLTYIDLVKNSLLLSKPRTDEYYSKILLPILPILEDECEKMRDFAWKSWSEAANCFPFPTEIVRDNYDFPPSPCRALVRRYLKLWVPELCSQMKSQINPKIRQMAARGLHMAMEHAKASATGQCDKILESLCCAMSDENLDVVTEVRVCGRVLGKYVPPEIWSLILESIFESLSQSSAGEEALAFSMPLLRDLMDGIPKDSIRAKMLCEVESGRRLFQVVLSCMNFGSTHHEDTIYIIVELSHYMKFEELDDAISRQFLQFCLIKLKFSPDGSPHKSQLVDIVNELPCFSDFFDSLLTKATESLWSLVTDEGWICFEESCSLGGVVILNRYDRVLNLCGRLAHNPAAEPALKLRSLKIVQDMLKRFVKPRNNMNKPENLPIVFQDLLKTCLVPELRNKRGPASSVIHSAVVEVLTTAIFSVELNDEHFQGSDPDLCKEMAELVDHPKFETRGKALLICNSRLPHVGESAANLVIKTIFPAALAGLEDGQASNRVLSAQTLGIVCSELAKNDRISNKQKNDVYSESLARLFALIPAEKPPFNAQFLEELKRIGLLAPTIFATEKRRLEEIAVQNMNSKIDKSFIKFFASARLVTRCQSNLAAANERKVDPETKKWRTVVGLEVHAQIKSKSKLFSQAGTAFRAAPNALVSPFDAGHPGTLPVLNKRCVEAGVATALALNCRINNVSTFDRKHYFYADLPAGYQITQQRLPLAVDGFLEFPVFNNDVLKMYRSKIKQIQLEQDSGKSLHDEDRSLVDLNRAGVGLMEIVCEPDLGSSAEAVSFVKELILVLKTIKTCDCLMEEGSLRVDVNVSVCKEGDSELGTRTEIKNLSSLNAVAKAVECESKRQISEVMSGRKVFNETRAFDDVKKVTVSMRVKETKVDYRFMPEPNLPPLILSEVIDVGMIERSLPELPSESRQRLLKNFLLKPLVAEAIVNNGRLLEFFLEVMSKNPELKPSNVANFLLIHVLAEAAEQGLDDFRELRSLTNTLVADLLLLVEAETITMDSAGKIIKKIAGGDQRHPQDIAENDGLVTEKNEDLIKAWCSEILENNPDLVKKAKKGKSRALNKLIQQLGKEHGDKLHMGKAARIIKEMVEKS
ncbi:unnamed protein product [Notodromas monacha]|uniref:Glutamyl-tRNA(Gln) amidotransferase subunit B, mitochondrial n=1 Tax=Notodromas monacha TaxID=399045 RepID=A0A7R9BVK6_9CRUS|nr:unnamed protein product [Notodromas monacha]CAG0922183.1 unnamed protein product [Notodromas monacha]